MLDLLLGRIAAILCALWLCSICSFSLADAGNHHELATAALADLRALSTDAMQGRKPGTTGHALAVNYLKSRFKGMGLQAFAPQYSHDFSYASGFRDLSGKNIVGWLAGTAKPDDFIVVTAHYDHLGQKGRRIFNGADDNASGVAAMLALAHWFSRQPPAHSFIFVATDAEESGLHGAKAFVAQPPVPIGQIRLNLNLDMLGNGGRRDDLYAFASNLARPWLTPLAERLQLTGTLRLRLGYQRFNRSYGRSGQRIDWRQASDHYEFGLEDIPYVYFGTDVHRHYHQSSDTFANIDQGFFTASVRCITAIAGYLDQRLLSTAEGETEPEC